MSGRVMRRLAEARPGHLDPDAPIGPRIRGAELARAMKGPRTRGAPTAGRGRRVPRPVWLLGLGAAGMALAFGLAGAIGGAGAKPGDPGPERSPENVRAVLLSAASRAESAPAPTGAYWHTSVTNEIPVRVGRGKGYTMLEKRLSENWTRVDGQNWFGHRTLGARPKTEADAAAWRRDGSPTRWDLGRGDTVGGEHRYLSTSPRPGWVVKGKGGSPFSIADKRVTYRQIQRLPADPAALKAWVVAAMRGNDDGPVPADAQDFFVARSLGSLLSEVPAPPQVRGAAFKALAGLPNVRGLGVVKDERGRAGHGIAVISRSSGGWTDIRLVIDTASSRILSEQVKTGVRGRMEPVKEGSSLYHEVGWTDSAPRVSALP